MASTSRPGGVEGALAREDGDELRRGRGRLSPRMGTGAAGGLRRTRLTLSFFTPFTKGRRGPPRL